MNYNSTLVNEGVTEKMFISIIMKGLPKEYESFTTLVKFSKEEKGLGEIKRDLINFDNEIVLKKSEYILQYRTKLFQLSKLWIHG